MNVEHKNFVFLVDSLQHNLYDFSLKKKTSKVYLIAILENTERKKSIIE